LGDGITIEWSQKAQKDVAALQPQLKRRIQAKLVELAQDKPNVDVKKLRGYVSRYRLRVGDYRILFEFDPELMVILVMDVDHRKQVYR
jgi:mRNA interferase RelE/StbE